MPGAPSATDRILTSSAISAIHASTLLPRVSCHCLYASLSFARVSGFSTARSPNRDGASRVRRVGCVAFDVFEEASEFGRCRDALAVNARREVAAFRLLRGHLDAAPGEAN